MPFAHNIHPLEMDQPIDLMKYERGNLTAKIKFEIFTKISENLTNIIVAPIQTTNIIFEILLLLLFFVKK